MHSNALRMAVFIFGGTPKIFQISNGYAWVYLPCIELDRAWNFPYDEPTTLWKSANATSTSYCITKSARQRLTRGQVACKAGGMAAGWFLRR